MAIEETYFIEKLGCGLVMSKLDARNPIVSIKNHQAKAARIKQEGTI
jgi:hypothetical protein